MSKFSLKFTTLKEWKPELLDENDNPENPVCLILDESCNTKAFFIPHVNKGKLFPQQDEVSGLKDYKLFKQYTSRGLGANFPLKILQFRLFNTPEINIIKLISSKTD